MASLPSAGEITEDSMKLIPHDGDSSPPPKPRSERAVSFSEIIINHNANMSLTDDNKEVPEVTITFDPFEDIQL